MKIVISSKNVNVNDKLKEAIEEKLSRLGKYFSDDIVVNTTLSKQGGRQKIEATINLKGTLFRAEEETNDLYSGIDRIVDKLSSQMSRFKTRLQKKHKGDRGIDFDYLPELEEEPQKTEVIRRKTFELMPMSHEEAIMQMELLSHNFFVFMNMDSDSVCVVYKRNDGGYGLLEPSY